MPINRRTVTRKPNRNAPKKPKKKVSLFDQVLALSRGYPIFTADRYTVDGVSGKVAALVDWNDSTHLLQQGTSGNQVPVPSPNALLQNRTAFAFTGTCTYDSNRSSSAWQFMIDGSGCEIYVSMVTVYAVTQYILSLSWLSGVNASTCTLNASGPTSVQPSYRVYSNAGVSPGVNMTATGGVIAAGGAANAYFRYDESASPEMSTGMTGGTQGTTTSGGTGFPGTPSDTFRLGGPHTGGVGYVVSAIRGVYLFPTLDTSQRAVVAAFLKQDIGV